MMDAIRSAGSIRLAQAAVCVALGAGCALSSSAQAAPDQDGSLKVNPLTVLREFEAPLNQEYTLGRGDEISIDFAGHPELSVKRVVGPDGRVTLPPAGSLLIADKTREAAAQAIEQAMAQFYTRPSVTVGVDKYTSNRVLLLGSVERPGPITFDDPPTLLEVLTVGGGVLRQNQVSTIPSPEGSGQLLRTASPSLGLAIPERCAIYRGSDQVLWVDLKGLVDSGNSLADLRLKRGDIVYVPAASERYVSILGQVGHPGALLLDRNTTLTKLLAEAGGLTQLAGKNPNIYIISAADGKQRTIPFKSLLQPGTLDLTLKSGDVIFVTESGFNSATYVLERLSPLLSLFTTAALLGTNR